MDFLDKLAIWLSGSSATGPTQRPSSEPQAESLSTTDISLESVESIESVDRLSDKLGAREFEAEDFEGNNPTIITLGDSLQNCDQTKTYNDIASSNVTLQQVLTSKSNNQNLLDKVIPFLNTKTDMGIWVYKNRYGVILTMSVYIAVLATMLFTNITLNSTTLVDGIYVEVPPDPQEQQLEEPKEMEQSDYTPQKVENIAVDRNVELDASLDDDRNTRTSDLYRQAQAAQQRLENNRQSYQDGLESVAELQREQPKSTGKENENTKKSINKAGNVAVEYDLKGRYVVDPEIPAYRCKGSGKVVVEVTVEQSGKVLSANIISMQGVSDECLPLMAVEAAKLTEFNIDYDAPKKAIGTVSFTFVAQ